MNDSGKNPEKIWENLNKLTTGGCVNSHELRCVVKTAEAILSCVDRHDGLACDCTHTSSYERYGPYEDQNEADIYATDVMLDAKNLLEENGMLDVKFKEQFEQFLLVRQTADIVKGSLIRGFRWESDRYELLEDIKRINSPINREKLLNYMRPENNQQWYQSWGGWTSGKYREELKERRKKVEQEFRQVKGWVTLQARDIRNQLIERVGNIIPESCIGI